MNPRKSNSSSKNNAANWLEDIVNYRMETGKMKALSDEDIKANSVQNNYQQSNKYHQNYNRQQNLDISQNQRYQKQNFHQNQGNYENNFQNHHQNFSNKQQYNKQQYNKQQYNKRTLSSNLNNNNPTEFDDTYRMRGINRQNNRKNDYNTNNNFVVQNRQQPNIRNNNVRRDKFLEQTTYGTLGYNNNSNENENIHTIYGKNHNNKLYLKDKKTDKNDKLKKIASFFALISILVLFVIVLDKIGVISL